MTLKHYVHFDTPGVFMPEGEIREVKTRIPARLRRIPQYTYALDYSDREVVRRKNEVLRGEEKNPSRRILFGQVITLKELKGMGYDKHSPLYRNLQHDGKGIKCITGNWQPWDKDWIILEGYEGLKTLKEAL